MDFKAWKLSQITMRKTTMSKSKTKVQLTKNSIRVLATTTHKFSTKNLSQKLKANPKQKSKYKN